MKLNIPGFEIDENDSFKNDVLNRRAFGEALLNIIIKSNDELVLSLNGQWGEGKTTFVEMWQGLLTKEGIPNLYIDAFSTDYIDDAFITIASAITDYAENNIIDKNEKKFHDFKNKTKKVGIQLLSWSTKVAIKAATLNIINGSDLESLKEIKDDLAQSASNLLADFIEEKLNSYSRDIELIKTYKDLLSELPPKLENPQNYPLVIIIDELDRCKPTFAVETLEKIKHLFSVKNVIFVLVMNKGQMEESIKNVYGKNIDAQSYLQKFINIELSLPKQTNNINNNDIYFYSKKLLKLYKFESWVDTGSIVLYTSLLGSHLNLSLRQIEKVFNNLFIFYSLISSSFRTIDSLIVFLAIIKVINPNMYEQLLHSKMHFKKISEIYNLKRDEKDTDYVSMNKIIDWLEFTLLTDKEIDEMTNDFEHRMYNYLTGPQDINRKMIIPRYAKIFSLFVTN